MDSQDLKEIREALLEKRRELLVQMGAIIDTESDASSRDASGDNSAYSFHLADQGTDAMEREKSFLYAQRDGKALYEVDQALARLEGGTYGVCLYCNDAIGIERLKYIPETQSCIGCKSRQEKSGNAMSAWNDEEDLS